MYVLPSSPVMGTNLRFLLMEDVFIFLVNGDERLVNIPQGPLARECVMLLNLIVRSFQIRYVALFPRVNGDRGGGGGDSRSILTLLSF